MSDIFYKRAEAILTKSAACFEYEMTF